MEKGGPIEKQNKQSFEKSWLIELRPLTPKNKTRF